MINQSKKPSKRIIYLAIGAFVVLVIIFVYKNHSASLILGEKSLFSNANLTAATPPLPDRDKDGLGDSQEINVWHTNPDKPDTDGDGTNDGDEVNQGRDPLKANTADSASTPNDYLSPGDPRISAAIQTVIATDNSNSGNLTQNLSKNFFTSYLTAQDASGSVSAENQAQIISQAISGTPAPSPMAKYSLGDLSIIDPASKDDIKSYGNDFALVYNNDLNAYLKISNPTYVQTAAYYQNLSTDLSKIRVPKAIAAYHLEIANDYNQMYVALQNLSDFQNDPQKGLIAVRSFKESHSIVITYYIKIANYFKNNAIIFANNEPGSMWSNL